MAKKRILVVDDEKLIRWSLEKNLDREGYEVVCSDCGKKAISILQSEIVDLVFGSEERIKNLLELFLGYPFPGIDKGKFNVFSIAVFNIF